MNLKKLSIILGLAGIAVFVVFAIFVGQIEFDNMTNAKILVYSAFIITGVLIITSIVLSKIASKHDYYKPTPTKKK